MSQEGGGHGANATGLDETHLACRLFVLMGEAFNTIAAWQFWLALMQATSGAMRSPYDNYDANEAPQLSRKQIEDTFRTIWSAAQVWIGSHRCE